MRRYIFGAQGFACGLYKAISILNPRYVIEGFVVSRSEGNPLSLYGLSVVKLESLINAVNVCDLEILIATPDNIINDIEVILDNVGIKNHTSYDSGRWSAVMRQAYSLTNRFTPLCNQYSEWYEPDVHVYKMIHEKDKPINSDFNVNYLYSTLQVGAADSHQIYANYYDNIGDNISQKNKYYSELTGLYWVWKNRLKSDTSKDLYIGMAHYRRYLDISEMQLRIMSKMNIDVVLPYPMPYPPDINEHHKRYLTDYEWDAVIQSLEELNQEKMIQYKKILSQEYFYNYNILIAKQKVLEEYCSWLFPIMFRIEEILTEKKNIQNNRYMGYVGETLETLYFMSNEHRLNIAHEGCKMIV